MYTKYFSLDENGEVEHIDKTSFREVIENNCTMPHIVKVIYNLQKKATENAPDTLATIVWFDDNSKVIVKNSVHDPITLEDKTLTDGSVIKVPSRQTKEVALMYAILKRMTSTFDENGKILNCGLNRYLNILIDEFSTVENETNAEVRIAKQAAKKAHLERQANAKPKAKRYSIHETLEKMNMVLDKLLELKSETKSEVK